MLSSPHTPSAVNLQQVLDAPVDKTRNVMELRAATHLVKRMMHSSSTCAQGSSLKLLTGGQVSTMSNIAWVYLYSLSECEDLSLKL